MSPLLFRILVMIQRKIAKYIAIVFFCVWLGLLLAAADFPPPRGFIYVIILDVILSWVVYSRAGTYIGWSASRKKHRLLRVLLDGLVAGFSVAVIVILLPVGGEPSVTQTSVDYVIWLSVLGTLGAANAILVYGISAFFSGELHRIALKAEMEKNRRSRWENNKE